MTKKDFLTSVFIAAATIGGGITWLAHDNREATEFVTKSGLTVTSSETKVLWTSRFGCPVYGSGTRYVAKDTNGKEVSGVVCLPWFGKPYPR